MWAIILDEDGTELERNELADSDLLDCDVWAQRYANQGGMTLETDQDGNHPEYRVGGDFRVELRPDPDNTVHLWNSNGYYFVAE